MIQILPNGLYSIHNSNDNKYAFTIKDSSQENETEIIFDKFENKET